MTFLQYQYLDEATREEVFLEQAVQVAQRTDQGCIYHLYQLYGFYIEVQYNISFTRVETFTAFESTSKLDPYLKLIPIAWPM